MSSTGFLFLVGTALMLAMAEAVVFQASELTVKSTKAGFSDKGSSIVTFASPLVDIAAGVITLAACTTRALHNHPRSPEVSYVYKGKVTAYIIFENNTVWSDVVPEGGGVVFPIGLFHWIENRQCTKSIVIPIFSNADYGTVTFGWNLEAIPQSFSSVMFNGSVPGFNGYWPSIPECLARCGIKPK